MAVGEEIAKQKANCVFSDWAAFGNFIIKKKKLMKRRRFWPNRRNKIGLRVKSEGLARSELANVCQS